MSSPSDIRGTPCIMPGCPGCAVHDCGRLGEYEDASCDHPGCDLHEVPLPLSAWERLSELGASDE